MNDELRTELLERADRDQAARNSLPPGSSHDEWQELVAPVDEANASWLKGVVAAHGWPGQSLAGEDGAHAAWLLLQHADVNFQEQCLPLMVEAVGRGDASPRDLAYLKDRVLMWRGEPQIYGTQYLSRTASWNCGRSATLKAWTSAALSWAWNPSMRTGLGC